LGSCSLIARSGSSKFHKRQDFSAPEAHPPLG
jgi:hypothetical protein